MSGGSYDYAYGRVRDLADAIDANARGPHMALRKAFAEHMRKVADAAWAIEWVDSGDKATGDEVEPIRAVLSPTAEVEAATKAARHALEQLEAALNRKDSPR